MGGDIIGLGALGQLRGGVGLTLQGRLGRLKSHERTWRIVSQAFITAWFIFITLEKKMLARTFSDKRYLWPQTGDHHVNRHVNG
jgi:hypothetical protein